MQVQRRVLWGDHPTPKLGARSSGKINLGFGFDDEEGIVGGMAGVAELLEGVVEGGGLDGEDYGAVVAADEVEAAFLLDELEVGGHFFGLRSLIRAKGRRPT